MRRQGSLLTCLADLLTCLAGCRSGLISASLVGPVSDAYNPQIIFYLCIPLAASILLPTALG